MMKNKRFKYIAGLAAIFLLICMFRSCCDALFAASREVYTSPTKRALVDCCKRGTGGEKDFQKALEYSDSCPRLLGNLLVLERYCNTVQQGLEGHETQLSVCLRYAQGLLWDYLGGRVDYENFEGCGKLDLDWVPYVLEIMLVAVCDRLASAIVASNRGVDSEKSMTQVHNSLSR